MTFEQWMQIINATIASCAVFVGVMNMRKINVVHTLTNSLATRNAELSKEAGLAEGKIIGHDTATTAAVVAATVAAGAVAASESKKDT